MPRSSFLLSPPSAPGAQPASAGPPGTPPAPPSAAGPQGARNSTLTILAGVGVLMLAMGVGVLIGRSGSSPAQSAPAAQVITVGSAGSGSTAAEASFASDWPSSRSGYTVELQTLPQAGTSVSAVEGAKAADAAKGAAGVGALRSEEFASLTAGTYVIYAGVDTTRAQALRALAGLRHSFPGCLLYTSDAADE